MEFVNQIIRRTKTQTNKFMARTIKSKFEYQVQELVSNLSEANSTTSNQKRDFYTSRALYNAKRLAEMVERSKIGA
jgi:hypothetical protein